MKFNSMPSRSAGYGLLEFMLAMALGIIVTGGVIVIFIAERQVYQNSSSQTLIQDSDNAISAIITPIVRGAGFTGCGGINDGVNTYLGATTTTLTFETASAVYGFTGTLPVSITDNAANDAIATDWAPALDGSLVGDAEPGSDVVTFIGAVPYSKPDGVAQFINGQITVADTSLLPTNVPQVMGLSDCGKSSVFFATTVNAGVVTFLSGPSPNGAPIGTVQYGTSTQLIPVQQTAFFVGKGDGNQSALYQGVMTPGANGASDATWTINEAVPGVIAMKALYGIGGGGQTTQYVDAAAVTNFAQINTVKLAFLIEGNVGSSPIPSGPQTYALLGNAVVVPADSRLRHVFNMTVNLRNDTLL